MSWLCLIKHKWSPWHWRRENPIMISHLNSLEQGTMIPGMRKCRRCGKRESAYSFPEDGE